MRSRLNKIKGLKLDKYSRAALFCLVLICLVGIFSRFIANDRPIVVLNDEDGIYFPIFSKKYEQKWAEHNGIPFDWSIHKSTHLGWPLIPYAPGESDLLNANYQPPFAKYISHPSECAVGNGYNPRYNHWLGTNLKGEDLLSGLIHGTSVSLKIGFFSILIALLIGGFLGLIAGYFQNDTWKVPLLSFVFILLSIAPSFYLADIFSFFLGISTGWKSTSLMLGTMMVYTLSLVVGVLLSYYSGKLIHQIFKWKKDIHVPVDTIVSRIIEVFAAVPKLMLVVALAAILERSVTNVIIVIGISSWAGIARLVRAETLKLRNQDFITSAKALGLKNIRIIFKHILPNISGPIIVSFVFGLSAAILIESGLSFLNMGVPENVITWGQLLADGKKNFNAWWLVVFPGFAIFITVLCLNILGEKFKSMLDPRNRSFN
jgi:peptide/nickel transport system permease protein